MIQIITKPFRWFFKLEAASGLVLLFAAIIALIVSNSNLSELYFSTLNKYLFLGINNFGLKLSVLHWINDALMAIFFFFVTLEIKREFLQGELSNIKQALLPIIAAVGGMLVPALFYVFINFGDSETMNGWAIPSATDIAFSLGVLSLLGKRVPLSLKVFLTALAIIDDLGAIVIIALFYSGDLSIKYLSLMLLAFIVLLVINKFNIKKFLPYLIVGIFLWDFTHNSGIHATIAGVLLASTIPHRTKDKDDKLYNRTFYEYDYATKSYQRYGDGDKSSTKEFGLYGRVDLMTEIGVIPKFLQQYEFLDFITLSKVPLFELSLQHITNLNTITSLAVNINDNVSFSMTTYSGAEGGTVQGGWLPEKNLWLGVRYRSDF